MDFKEVFNFNYETSALIYWQIVNSVSGWADPRWCKDEYEDDIITLKKSDYEGTCQMCNGLNGGLKQHEEKTSCQYIQSTRYFYNKTTITKNIVNEAEDWRKHLKCHIKECLPCFPATAA